MNKTDQTEQTDSKGGVAWLWAMIAVSIIGMGIYEQFWTSDKWWDVATNYLIGGGLLFYALFEFADDGELVDLTEDEDA